MRKILLLLWRIWFYTLGALPVIILFPLLASFLLFSNGYRYLYWVARNIWSPFIIFGMGFWIKRVNKFPKQNKSIMLIANHSSYIDIMLMFRMSKKPFIFVGKKELTKIPFFGYLYKRVAITVDRSSFKSRKDVYKDAIPFINKGYSVCVFPEREYLDETILLNAFKRGAFKIAIEHKLKILPIIFLDCKRKFPWYTTHGFPGELRVKAMDLIDTNSMRKENINELTDKMYEKIYRELLNDPKQNAVKAILIWEKMTS